MVEEVGKVDGFIGGYLEEGRIGRRNGGDGGNECVGCWWQIGSETFQDERLDIGVFVINQGIESGTCRLADGYERMFLFAGRPTGWEASARADAKLDSQHVFISNAGQPSEGEQRSEDWQKFFWSCFYSS